MDSDKESIEWHKKYKDLQTNVVGANEYAGHTSSGADDRQRGLVLLIQQI
jgi:hypothetical protein